MLKCSCVHEADATHRNDKFNFDNENEVIKLCIFGYFKYIFCDLFNTWYVTASLVIIIDSNRGHQNPNLAYLHGCLAQLCPKIVLSGFYNIQQL